MIGLRLLTLYLAVVSPALAQSTNPITRQTVLDAQQLIGLDFSDPKIDLMLPGLREQLRNYKALRAVPLPNSVPPAVLFNPIPVGMVVAPYPHKSFKWSPPHTKLPADQDALAFYSVSQLAALIKSRQVTSEILTRFFLDRLKRLGPKLECFVTLREEAALQDARSTDAELAAGHYRGPLHGIPYGAKDLLATKDIPTTWGAAPWTNQICLDDSTVVKRLAAAGAILIAKTTLGELAMGETWFGGMTRNPWNTNQGSSGSSAGSCAATAAGLIPFGIGTETLGSIVSPCDRCGVTGLRPSYGRVSRTGAMALSWTMDKIGPICRTAEDCALVFNAIYGPDGQDQTLYNVPFNYNPNIDLKKLRIGYLQSDFEKETGARKTNSLAALQTIASLVTRSPRQQGTLAGHPSPASNESSIVNRQSSILVPLSLPTNFPLNDISFLLSTEAAAAFDELTRSGQDDWLKQQEAWSWPNTFRRRRFVPAVEYIQAQRLRYLLIQEMARVFDKVDIFVAPATTGRSLLLSNLTGNPCVVVPDGFSTNGTPTSICFIGKLFGEAQLLAVAKKFQDATDFHKKHPDFAASPSLH